MQRLTYAGPGTTCASLPKTTTSVWVTPCCTPGSILAAQHWQHTQQAMAAATMPKAQAAQPKTTK